MPPVHDKVFEKVCLGGTFDTIHVGHEKLLNKALSVCTKVLTVGVTDESMIKKKLLWELIIPLDDRIRHVTHFLEKQIQQNQGNAPRLDIVPISDPFGPAITDASIEAIVVSDETIPGGNKINQIRREKGMKELELISVSLLPDTNKETSFEEDKVSSSSLRIRKLGTLLKEPLPREEIDARIAEWFSSEKGSEVVVKKPYFIGLTGAIAAGKTNIGKDLESLGAGLIDCDLFAHQVYKKGSEVYSNIVHEFGPDIVDQDTQEIVRRKLGQIVFNDSSLKAKLEKIVWPATNLLVKQEIEKLTGQDKKVIVLEAAQLIEAKWHEKLHQLWVSIIPPDVAVKRVMERNGLTEEEAMSRVSSQMSNKERVSHANVVLCSLWEREFTKLQVQKAWNLLQKRFLIK